MLYRGRQLDAISLWSRWVEFPSSTEQHGFSSLVRCPNPEHSTEKRHFQVNLDQPLVHCFAGCGISGTYERAIALVEGVSEVAARKIILKSCTVSNGRIPDKRRRSRRVQNNDGRRGVENEVEIGQLDYATFVPNAGMEYLGNRGIDGSAIASWGIGWDQDDLRIVIPAKDERGHVRFLIKRAVKNSQWPKYLYSPEKEVCGWGKTDLLFGACNLDLNLVRSHGLVLCEGSLDCVRLHQNGIRNAVAILGTYLSERQVAIISNLRPNRIFLLFDKDAAGYRAIKRANDYLCKFPLHVCLYPKGKSDPAELDRKEVERSIERAISIVKFNQRLPERLKFHRRQYVKAAV